MKSQNDDRIKRICHKGMIYYGVKKEYVGCVDKETFFANHGRIVNTFGYYQNANGNWSFFVIDAERGVEEERRTVPSEEDAIAQVLALAEIHNYAYFKSKTTGHLEERRIQIFEYLKKEYAYTEEKAHAAVDYLFQNIDITLEFLFYIEFGDFVPNKYACVYSGYTAKRINAETYLTVLGAFNYMIYLKRKPNEALANLKRGLPRRRILSDSDVKKIKGESDS